MNHDQTPEAETPKAPLVLTELEVKDFKRIKLVRVYPDGQPVVTVGGENAQGKTSLLDSIAALLGGGDMVPKTAVRRGAKRGHVIGKLGPREGGGYEYEVERTFTPPDAEHPKGRSAIVIRTADGAKVDAPQGVLNKMFSAISFDPLEFIHASDQGELLRRAIGCDFSKLDQERAQAYTDRTVANRRVRDLEGQVRGLPHHPGVPAQEVTNAELGARYEAESEKNAARAELKRAVDDAERVKGEKGARVLELRAQLQAAEDAFLAADDAVKAATAAYEAAPVGDLEALKLEVAKIDETNAKVRANRERDAKQKELDEARERVEELEETIKRCDREKASMLAAAQFPVEGLTFSPEGVVLLNGLPLSEAAESERIRLSAAIGFALNPRVRILLVRQGAYLSTKGRALLAELAAAKDGQVWLEVVSDTGAGCSIVLEDGEIRGAA